MVERFVLVVLAFLGSNLPLHAADCPGVTLPLAQEDCPEGFLKVADRCYYQATGTWQQGKDDCTKRGGRLAWAETPDKICRVGLFLENTIGATYGQQIYVGGRRLGNEAAVTNWVDGDCVGPVIDTSLFRPNQPDNWANSEPAIEILWAEDEWWLNDHRDNKQQPYVCEVDAGATCPEGYTYVHGGCYYFEVSAKKNWHDAVADCWSRGDRLAWVETAEEQCRLGSAIRSFPGHGDDIWVGGRRVGNEVRVLNWMEDGCIAGPQIDAGLFYQSNLDNAGGNEPTVELRWYGNDHGWVFNDMPQTSQFSYICEMYDAGQEASCPDGYTSVGGGCYYFEVDAKKTWRGAMASCAGRGDRLAWVETSKEQCRLGSASRTFPGHRDALWVGGRRLGNEVRVLNWMEDQCGTAGPEIDAGLFYQSNLDNAGGNEPTVELRWYNNDEWEFNDMPEAVQHAYICEMYDAPEPDVSCPDGYPAIDGSCYYVETEVKQNWHGALADCVSRGAKLAWVETAEEQCKLGALVESLFTLNYGAHFDVWVGGKRLGSEVRVVNWIEDECVAGPQVDAGLFYQPHLDNAGGNEATVELRWYPNHGWVFNDMPEDLLFPYICEISPADAAAAAAAASGGGGCDAGDAEALQEEIDGANADLDQANEDLATLEAEIARLKKELEDALAGGEKIMPTASPTATLSDTAYKFTLDLNGIEYILETTPMHIALDSDDFCQEFGMKLAQIENQETLDAIALQLKSISDQGVDLPETATGERSSVNLDRDIAIDAFNAAGWNCGTLVPDGDTFKMVGKKCNGQRAVLCAAVPLYC